jgi:hypothetical protein
MNSSFRWFAGLSLFVLTFGSVSAFAKNDRECVLEGKYGYSYSGASYQSSGTVPLAEAGSFSIDAHGTLSGVGTLTFQFSNFAGQGPLWLLLREEQASGKVTPDAVDACTGTVEFFSTATVIKTSNAALVPVGTVLFSNAPRSISYAISGQQSQTVDLVSTSPGTIASGTATRQATK